MTHPEAEMSRLPLWQRRLSTFEMESVQSWYRLLDAASSDRWVPWCMMVDYRMGGLDVLLQ